MHRGEEVACWERERVQAYYLCFSVCTSLMGGLYGPSCWITMYAQYILWNSENASHFRKWNNIPWYKINWFKKKIYFFKLNVDYFIALQYFISIYCRFMVNSYVIYLIKYFKCTYSTVSFSIPVFQKLTLYQFWNNNFSGMFHLYINSKKILI